MKNLISKNVESIEISGIRKFYNKVVNYPDAISLTLGQPDFNVPEAVKEAMIVAIQSDKTVYTANAGIYELRMELSNYLKNMNINYSAEDICITVGGSEGLLSVFTALINTGDKILVPTPAYPAYESCVKLLGGKVINYNLNKCFGLDFENIEATINTEKPKAIVLSFPSNPTGAVLTKEDKQNLFQLLKDKDITIITDEIYSALNYSENHYSIAQYEELLNKTILVSGFSKMLSMTGLRVGYVCAKDKYMNHIMKVHQYGVSCAPSIGQYGALEGLKSCKADVENMKQAFKDRRNYLYDELIKLGFDCVKPEGAFYMFPSIKKYGMNSEEFCERLLKEAKVAIVPGSAFGIGGEGYIRISYSYSSQELSEGVSRISKWMKTI